MKMQNAQMSLMVGHGVLIVVGGFVAFLKALFGILAFFIVLLMSVIQAALGGDPNLERAIGRLIEDFLLSGLWVTFLHAAACVMLYRNFRVGWWLGSGLTGGALLMSVFGTHPLLAHDVLRFGTGFTWLVVTLTFVLFALHFLPENTKKAHQSRWALEMRDVDA